MTTAARSRFLALLREADTGLKADLAEYVARVRTLLLNEADHDGHIPIERWPEIQRQIIALLLAYFVDGSGHAYRLAHNGTLVPTSPYLRRLWAAVEQATRLGVGEQADDLRSALRDFPELIRPLEIADANPFLPYVYAGMIDAEVRGLFSAYVPPQSMEWDDHRTLDDRVLIDAAATRGLTARLLRQLLSEQKSPAQIAQALGDYFAGRGTRSGLHNGAFNAQRLLATSINYAYQNAQRMSAALNPFVATVDWVLSSSHREVDICDSLAAGSPYSVATVPPFPGHAGCLCRLVFHNRHDITAVVSALRGSPLLKVQGALSPRFADLLLRGFHA